MLYTYVLERHLYFLSVSVILDQIRNRTFGNYSDIFVFWCTLHETLSDKVMENIVDIDVHLD